MLLGFKKQFAHKILEGSKKFTIRSERKVSPKVGETIHMYSGLRTKHTKLISKDYRYTGAQKVKIQIYSISNYISLKIYIDGKPQPLTEHQTSTFVKADGFATQKEFADYWLEGKQRLTSIRTIYHWTDLRY